jgi:hypothetical protein
MFGQLFSPTVRSVVLSNRVRFSTRAEFAPEPSELQSYYLFAEKFGRPAKGNDKGKVEGLVCGCNVCGLGLKPMSQNREMGHPHLRYCSGLCTIRRFL